MNVKGLQGWTVAQVQDELVKGGKFVQYTWCVSMLVVTFRYHSPVYFLRKNQNAFKKGLPFTIMTLLLGWWSIPYGPLYTLASVYRNMEGQCVTVSVMERLYRQTQGYVFEFERARQIALA